MADCRPHRAPCRPPGHRFAGNHSQLGEGERDGDCRLAPFGAERRTLAPNLGIVVGRRKRPGDICGWERIPKNGPSGTLLGQSQLAPLAGQRIGDASQHRVGGVQEPAMYAMVSRSVPHKCSTFAPLRGPGSGALLEQATIGHSPSAFRHRSVPTVA